MYKQMTLVKSRVSVGVIGSAGRLEDSKKMTKELYEEMLKKLKAVITKKFKLDLKKVHLISGGAAWAGKVIKIHTMYHSLVATFTYYK